MNSIELIKIAKLHEKGSILIIDDPYPIKCTPRWGYGKPLNRHLCDLFDKNKDTYISFIKNIVLNKNKFESIHHYEPEYSIEPRWKNNWLPALDCMSIYTMLAKHFPRRFIEIGSGNSTKFAARAIRDHNLPTKIFSIDPHPRSEIDQICHRNLRFPLEAIDLSFFKNVNSQDIIFLDCSHRSLQNSDVTTFFLDVLPSIPEGCIIGIHDICLPMDYPPEWSQRYYNEQYLLACMFLFGQTKFEILFPSAYVSITSSLCAHLEPLKDIAPLEGLSLSGSIFWMQKKHP